MRRNWSKHRDHAEQREEIDKGKRMTKIERGAEVRSKDPAVALVANGSIIQNKGKHKQFNGENRSIAVECTRDQRQEERDCRDDQYSKS